MPQLPSKTGREPQPPSSPAAHPSLGRPLLVEQGTVGARGEGQSCLHPVISRAGRRGEGPNIPPGPLLFT